MKKKTRKTPTPKQTAAPHAPGLSPIEYELAFVRGYDRVDETIEADLTSPLLDPAMHPAGTIRVVFFTRAAGPKGAPGFVLNSRMIESLAAYLGEQTLVRESIQPYLEKDLGVVRANGWFRGRGGVWQNMTWLRLELRERAVPAGRTKARAGAAGDAARWEFDVVCRPEWDDHYGTFRFRDGKLVHAE
jgi:hypothetical protein